MKQYLCALYLFVFAHQTLLHAENSCNPILKFIIGINEDSVLVNKKVTRAGLPIYRAYSFSIIQEAGYYRLAGNVANQITIASSNVQLDLGGSTVSGGIVINSNLRNITIMNGTVTNNSSNAITVNTECSSIKISDVKIQGQFAGPGVIMTQTIDCTIRNCDLIQNTTGVSLNSCNNIVIQDCNAIENRFAGYSLLTSTTCIITGCKAISTGSTNTSIILTSVFGFVSNNGGGNIFDSCIANSTQALTTTDSNSVIAGFALRGTEKSSNITHCMAMNTATSQNGLTIPYGILLEATRISSPTPTGFPPDPQLLKGGFFSTDTEWSPDSKYLAVTSAFYPYLAIYEFNRKNIVFNMIAIPNITTEILNDNNMRIQWSPSGKFIALTQPGGNLLIIYAFNPTNQTLTRVFQLSPSPSLSGLGIPSWRFDEKYLAISTNSTLRIFKFDAVTYNLQQVASTPISASSGFNQGWSPDGNYFVCPLSTSQFSVFKFDESTNSLPIVATATISGTSAQPSSTLFSPNGQYIVQTRSLSTPNEINIWRFDRNTNTLSLYASAVNGDRVESLAWSPDGQYISSGTTVYSFNPQARTITSVFTFGLGGAVCTTSNFSPDGEYFVISPETVPFFSYDINPIFRVFKFLNFPQNNSVAYNTVYCNTGNNVNQQSGIGISGSSSSNFIYQNTVYSNPSNPPIIPFNYLFVLNVFNPLFQDVPTLMQNIALGTCDPILVRRDRAQDFEVLVSKLTDIATKIDTITVT